MAAIAIAALVVGLSLGGDARAQGAADESISGSGVVMAKDAERGIVTIGITPYRVTDATRLEGRRGEEIRFSDIPVFEDGSGEAAGDVRFEAHRSGSTLELDLLVLTEPPR